MSLLKRDAKQMNATTISLPSSHASLVSHPNEIAQLILNATKGVTKKQTNVIGIQSRFW
jgi:hypothetical protein